MDGEKRRELILGFLNETTQPTSGTHLSKELKVSRQIIVQDVALLRASGYDILATARGYILNQEAGMMQKRVILVKHTPEELEDELNTIVDNGGRVRDVIISHPIYGELVGDLMLKTRRDIKQFVDKVNNTSATPLMHLTNGMHMHTIEASSKEELDIIEEELHKKGYLRDTIHEE
ncbi:transcription repressor NadR [Cellulosilyticum sp. I15G10I2]|uniref:transcription repressor NadR n=1 Tax=Cellulosilyticum sp. I15G10I2 TaxID=1892843 RepID=UPI00085BC3E2|nr:transcription repressor NadR [Cellulosilyticum sp. I15G10I2]